MPDPFFDHPILNSPYECPPQHWELDAHGQPTQRIIESRRRAEFITPIPKPKKRKVSLRSRRWSSTKAKAFPPRSSNTTPPRSSTKCAAMWTRGGICLPESMAGHPGDAPAASALAAPQVQRRPPFFCQVEAVETAIWLTEVAPHSNAGKRILDTLRSQQRRQPRTDASRAEAGHRRGQDHRHGHAHRVADDQRRPPSRQQALHPRLSRRRAGPDHQGPPARPAAQRPGQLLRKSRTCAERHAGRREPAKIVITNYHAFKLRERIELSEGGRQLAPRTHRRRARTPSKPKAR